MGNRQLIVGILLIVLSLIGMAVVSMSFRTSGQGTSMMRRGMRCPMLIQRPASYGSNGERIYWTAVDNSGKAIPFQGGPPWLAMCGGSCVDCHRPDGNGGPVMMSRVSAPAIRYSVLTSAPSGGMAGMEHPAFTDATIKRAITEGLDPAGNRLNPTMPRWQMSDPDLNDVIAYLKVLGT